MIPEFSLRSASADDVGFLWELRKQTMRPHIQNSYGWNDEEEYEYAKERLSCTRIVQIKNKDIGIVKVAEFDTYFFLFQIQLRPEWSNQGIGAQIIADLILSANEKKKTIRLHVLKNNPAKGLYTRLGFVVIEEFKFQVMMEYAAQS